MVPHPSSDDVSRRRLFSRVLAGVYAAIGGSLASVTGAAVLAPSFAAHTPRWLEAAAFDGLAEDGPTPITLRITRQDGYRTVIDRRVVYLSRDGAGVRALDSTCSHLGCRTRFDAESRRFLCPCHGGAYDVDGHVVAGPPPTPLRRLEARVEAGRVYVQV